ncbi:putative necrosis-inducing factor domain containing protein [Rhypophila sp. PSN 637]
MLEDIEYTDNQWSVDAVGHHTLAEHNTCAVGVELYYPWDYIIWVGNVDIKHIVNMSIDEFGIDGRVGTKGYMRCKRTVYTEDGPNGLAVFSIYFNPKYSET